MDSFVIPHQAIALRNATLAERLKALWQLSTDQSLDLKSRIRAMLGMAADALDMELAVLGKFGQNYTTHYVHDSVGVVSEGMVMALQDSICIDVYQTGTAVHVPDLSQYPSLSQHPMVIAVGMRLYSGIPVRTNDSIDWVLAFMRREIAPVVSADDRVYMELVADWLGNALGQSDHQQALQKLALTDTLTGLPNRRAAEERLQQEVARVQRNHGGFALALVDLDHFKRINDRYGHAIGDQVLKTVSHHLHAGLRDGDWVARWGGEEFLFFLHNSSSSEATRILERQASSVKRTPMLTDVGPVPLTLSAGIAAVHQGNYDIPQVLDLADISLRQAKSAGRDQIHAVPVTGADWSIHTIKKAVNDKQLRLATQFIFDLKSGTAVADESLARLVTDKGELIIAEAFIDMAEGLGLSAELDRQMAQLSMQRCVLRLSQGYSTDFAHFVNLSPQFLARRDLVEELLQNAQMLCAQCDVSMPTVKPIVLEITERQRIGNLDALRNDLQPLLDFGFRLALDDFGSGYSSYMYLAQLPISFLKIEGSLIRQIQQERKVASIVESIANFARKEGIQTVAEHVENAETARILREMGVDWAQGWFFGSAECET